KRKMDLMNPNVDLKAEKKAPKKTEKRVEEKGAELSYEEKKELKRKKNKFQNQVKRSEEKIEELEMEVAKMDEMMATLDYTTPESTKALEDYEKLKNDLDEQMALWEEATEILLEME
ncbi:MAG: hypothetical protein ACPGVI_02820, partial [Crocinitomicaceae bacterium]